MLQERNVFYDAYVRTYLQRDIKDILNITDANRFLQFLRMIAARTGQLLNYSDILPQLSLSVIYKSLRTQVIKKTSR